MLTHTQLWKLLVRMLISLIALRALGQGTGATQSSLKLTPAFVRMHRRPVESDRETLTQPVEAAPYIYCCAAGIVV